jgi:hypothetical protein
VFHIEQPHHNAENAQHARFPGEPQSCQVGHRLSSPTSDDFWPPAHQRRLIGRDRANGFSSRTAQQRLVAIVAQPWRPIIRRNGPPAANRPRAAGRSAPKSRRDPSEFHTAVGDTGAEGTPRFGRRGGPTRRSGAGQGASGACQVGGEYPLDNIRIIKDCSVESHEGERRGTGGGT